MAEKINFFASETDENPEEDKNFESEKELTQLEAVSKTTDPSVISKWFKRVALIGVSSFVLFPIFKGIESTKEYKDYKDRVVESSKGEFEKEKEFLIQEIGEKNFEKIEKGDRVSFYEKNDERKDPEVKDAEKMGLSNAIISQIVEDGKFFPANYVKGEVEKIVFGAESQSMENYGMQGNSAADVKGFSGEIMQFSRSGELNERQKPRDQYAAFVLLFSHEISHLNDWENDQDLNLSERASLLGGVIKLMNQKNCMRGFFEETFGQKGYHQQISVKNKEDETYLKAKEYLAEIGSNYLSCPSWLKINHPKEFNLFDDYVKRGDPNFNPIASRENLIEFLKEKVKN